MSCKLPSRLHLPVVGDLPLMHSEKVIFVLQGVLDEMDLSQDFLLDEVVEDDRNARCTFDSLDSSNAIGSTLDHEPGRCVHEHRKGCCAGCTKYAVKHVS